MSNDAKKPSARPPRRYRLALWAVLATAAAGGLGYLSFTQWSGKQAMAEALAKAEWNGGSCSGDLEKTRGDNAELTKNLASCTTQRDADQARYRDIETNLERLQQNMKASAEELEDLRKQRAEVEKRLEAFKGLTAKLKAMIDSGQIEVVVRKGRMLVELPAEVLFPSGSADLSEDGKMALMRVAISLEQFRDRHFMVAGHTDDVPLRSSRYRNNWELATARAVTVTEFLVGAGLSPKNLVAAGYGEHDPIASNKTDKGRQKNRRIEIILLPNLEELPAIPDDLARAMGAESAD